MDEEEEEEEEEERVEGDAGSSEDIGTHTRADDERAVSHIIIHGVTSSYIVYTSPKIVSHHRSRRGSSEDERDGTLSNIFVG